MANILLKGSERAALHGARVTGPAHADERLEVSVLLRRRSTPAMDARVTALASGERLAPLSRQQFAREHGADPADFARVGRLRSPTASSCCRNTQRAGR
jgi:kumamolisin